MSTLQVVITTTISVIVALSAAITAPVILLKRTESQHSRDRHEDWARQDAAAEKLKDAQDAQADAAREVARKAQRAADDLAASQKEIADQAARAAELLLASNAQVAATAEQASTKLDVIHALVNSNMTASMDSELGATRRELATMQEIVQLKRTLLQQEPSVEALAAIESTKARIAELSARIADRSNPSPEAS